MYASRKNETKNLGMSLNNVYCYKYQMIPWTCLYLDGCDVCYAGGNSDGGLCAGDHLGGVGQEQQVQGDQDGWWEEDKSCHRVAAGGHGG